MSEDQPIGRAADRVTIEAGRASATIDSSAGGRIAQITVAGQPLLIDADESSAGIAWGSFPMAPWAGRIRHGRFTFEGRVHQLECNHVDEPGRGTPGTGSTDDRSHHHAIHGTVFGTSWHLDEVLPSAVWMHSALAGDEAPVFEAPVFEASVFRGGIARQWIEISPDGLECGLSVEAARSPFPAVIGWHPWFLGPERLRFRPRSMYQRDRFGITTSVRVEPTSGPWDDCFIADGPAILEYDRAEAPTVTISSDCDHWVVYDEPAESICVEPQSGPPDGFNIGCAMVAPGRPLARTMRLSW